METMMEALRVEERTSTRILDFDGEFVDQHFSVQIWLLANACFVWIGLDSTSVSLGSMSTAVKTKYDPLPLASSLIGGGSEIEQQMAQRLVLRTGRQVFVSCNLPDDDMDLGAFIERAIIKRLNQESR
ncbi:proteasome (prosome, macropain) assembly chaperone 4 [Aphanomyces cochlioides]|nr:proteasome (prosome, macropain) assembly chaperone 4 [Aphanomyces cochlioides]